MSTCPKCGGKGELSAPGLYGEPPQYCCHCHGGRTCWYDDSKEALAESNRALATSSANAKLLLEQNK